MLRDSGFYKINISKAYPLIWGNPETGVAFDDFSTGSPRSWPPDLYYITSNSQSPLVPSFDFKMRLLSINLPSSIPTCPRNESTSFCYAQQWYQGPLKDGMNIDLYNLAFDYIYQPRYYQESIPLLDNQAFITINNGFIDSKPFNFTCNENNSITFMPTGAKAYTEFICENAGQNFAYQSGPIDTTVSCPDPKIFCKTMNLVLNAFTEETSPFKKIEIIINSSSHPIVRTSAFHPAQMKLGFCRYSMPFIYQGIKK